MVASSENAYLGLSAVAYGLIWTTRPKFEALLF